MNDISPRRPTRDEHSAASRRSSSGGVKKFFAGIGKWIRRHPKFVGSLILIFALVMGGLGLYRVGYSRGQAAQKKADEKLLSQRRDTVSQSNQNRQTVAYSGQVDSISASEIAVKTTKGEVKRLVIDKDTTITDMKSTKIEANAIKKGQQVSVVGANKDGKDIAKRIRLMPTQSTTPKPVR